MRLGPVKKKDSYSKAQFNRLKSRLPKKAICAVVASMLTAIYHMLKDGVEHQDLQGAYYDRRSIGEKKRAWSLNLSSLASRPNFSLWRRLLDGAKCPVPGRAATRRVSFFLASNSSKPLVKGATAEVP
jgi:hypothetical protein